MHSTSFIAFLAALPATLACLAETSLPASTGSESLSEPQYIASGETFDGEFVKVLLVHQYLVEILADLFSSTTVVPHAVARVRAARPTLFSFLRMVPPFATSSLAPTRARAFTA